jgi:hypothetical protein
MGRCSSNTYLHLPSSRYPAGSLAVGQAVIFGPSFRETTRRLSPSCESVEVAVAVDPLGTSATITATHAGVCA